jgi:hypothetical protein
MYVAPKSVSGLVVNTSMARRGAPSTGTVMRAPSLRPIQLRWRRLHPLGPVDEVEVGDEPLAVGGDPHLPLAQRAACRPGKLPRSLLPSAVTSSLASTVPSPGTS